MSRILIAYFSRAGENYFGGAIRTVKVGNTEIAANFIQKLTDADVYKIEMKTPYSQDYKTCVSEAVRDLKSSARPEIIDPPEDIHGYDTVILAYPSYCRALCSRSLKTMILPAKRSCRFAQTRAAGWAKAFPIFKRPARVRMLRTGFH